MGTRRRAAVRFQWTRLAPIRAEYPGGTRIHETFDAELQQQSPKLFQQRPFLQSAAAFLQ